ncbi:hypothetical protein DOTSEDRAFT_37525 [Dothistroma septosporum NZE10]|uniref:Uncharacterized protein n=1 Tax=Dothistroma septosporum (strain NZE10 / CBS 128990) TaxID=675120 RepID=N1PGW2_DOTSN|nr:hypothetical protein DOTSEDRAFT_37525 [Dothistroma septosporum NZE10]
MPHTEAPPHIPQRYIAFLTDDERRQFREMFASVSDADREEMKQGDVDEWKAFCELHWQLVEYDEEEDHLTAVSQREQVALHIRRRCRPLSAIFETDEEYKRQSVLNMAAMADLQEALTSPALPATPADTQSPTPAPLQSYPPEAAKHDPDYPVMLYHRNSSYCHWSKLMTTHLVALGAKNARQRHDKAQYTPPKAKYNVDLPVDDLLLVIGTPALQIRPRQRVRMLCQQFDFEAGENELPASNTTFNFQTASMPGKLMSMPHVAMVDSEQRMALHAFFEHVSRQDNVDSPGSRLSDGFTCEEQQVLDRLYNRSYHYGAAQSKDTAGSPTREARDRFCHRFRISVRSNSGTGITTVIAGSTVVYAGTIQTLAGTMLFMIGRQVAPNCSFVRDGGCPYKNDPDQDVSPLSYDISEGPTVTDRAVEYAKRFCSNKLAKTGKHFEVRMIARQMMA